MSSNIVAGSGAVPYVTASESNNSVGTYIAYDISQAEEGNSIMIGGKTLVVTYQANNYFSNDSHNLALYVRDKAARKKETQLFLVSALYKSLKPKYTWGNSISRKKIQDDVIELPVMTDKNPDFEFMEKFTRAQQKLAIKNVVEWRDRYIATAKTVIAASA